MLRVEVPDGDDELAAVRLVSDLQLADEARTFARADGSWTFEVPPELRLDRLEYELELEGPDGEVVRGPDPNNPLRAPGAFGERSVVEAEGYVAPWWLDEDRQPAAGHVEEWPIRVRYLRRAGAVRLWSPADSEHEEPLPLLLVHDGPEFDALGQVLRYVAVLIADDELPRLRVALLPPGERDEWYSASSAYARALCTQLLPALGAHVAVRGLPVAVGASLGGLAALHAQRQHPGTFGGLFLQSGSFFMPRFDAHESGFPRYGRIVRFTRAVLRAIAHGDTPPTVLTCGVEEENIHNNRLVAAALARQGYDARLVEVGDLHNYTAWRDTFDPHLTDLLVRAFEGK